MALFFQPPPKFRKSSTFVIAVMSSVFPKLCTFCESVEITRKKGGDVLFWKGLFSKTHHPYYNCCFLYGLCTRRVHNFLFGSVSVTILLWRMSVCTCNTTMKVIKFSWNVIHGSITTKLEHSIQFWHYGKKLITYLDYFTKSEITYVKIILLVVSKERCQIKPKSKLRSLNPAGGLTYFFAH